MKLSCVPQLRDTCSELADSVQQLELPAFLHIMDGLGYLVAWCLNIELQAEAVDVPVSCRDCFCLVIPSTIWQKFAGFS